MAMKIIKHFFNGQVEHEPWLVFHGHSSIERYKRRVLSHMAIGRTECNVN